MKNDNIESLTRLIDIALDRKWQQKPWFADAVISLDIEVCQAEGNAEGVQEAMKLARILEERKRK
jgi:hypothetical protein